MACTVVCGVLCGLGAAAQAYLLSFLVATAFAGQGNFFELRGPLFLLIGIILLRGGLSWLEERCALFLGGSVQKSLRRRLLKKIDELGPLKIHEQKYGELLTLLTEGLDALEVYFQKYLPQFFKSAMLPLAFLVIIFPVDWQTGLLMALTAPLVPLFMFLIGQWTKKHTLRQWRILSFMGGYFQDVFEGLTTLKLFNRTEMQRKKIAAISEDFRTTNLQVLQWGFLSSLVLEMLTTISIAMIAVGLGLRLVYGMIGFKSALFLLFLAPEFYLPLRSLSAQYHNSLNGAAAAKSIFALLAQENDRSDYEEAAINEDTAIVFDEVCFAYEEGRLALNGVSFMLQPGEKLGLVGVSGSGKTTLMHMLSGFIKPDKGSITWGGQILSEINTQKLREKIAFVTQDPFLFKGSVMDNICLGNNEASEEAIVLLCKELGAHELFSKLPFGYDTPVGQGGNALSGGERQMLAIARAYVKNTPLIILDEACRNMDWQHNYMLQQAFLRLSYGKTVIVIAHRLQTLASMDKLLVLEQGQVAQFGTFAELSVQKGVLLELLQKQETSEDAQAEEQESFLLKTKQIYDSQGVDNIKTAKQVILGQTAQKGCRAPQRPYAPLTRMLALCRPYLAYITGSCVLSAAAIAANIALLGFSSYLISRASLAPPLLDLMTTIVAVRFFGISRAVLRYAERYISHDVTFRILTKLRLWYYDQMEKLSYVSLQKLGLGRIFKHIISDVDTLKFFFLRVVTVPAQAVLIWAAVAIFLGFFSWKLSLILSAFFLIGGLIAPYLLQRFLHNRRTDYDAHKLYYSETLYDYINGLADLQLYKGIETQLYALDNLGNALTRERYYIGFWEGFAAVSSAFLANLALFAALIIMITLVAENKVHPLTLASAVWVMWASFEALQPVAVMTEYLKSSRAALYGMEEAAARPREVLREGKMILAPPYSLRLKHLSFAYAESPSLLKDISFTLKPGSKTALLGSSGAGKTTLLNIITGLLPYENGQVFIGDTDLNEVKSTSLRQSIGYLDQRPYLFHASIRENILLAKEGVDEQQMQAAAAQARLGEFIASLPQGYDTLVGENGYKLSAGQRQRLAVARLFVQDAPLLILDEATQSLDTQTRDDLFTALKDWWAEKTVLFVTHDCHGLSNMDNILIMEQGRIVEQGSEEELLKAGGHYAQIYAIEHSFF